MRRLRATAIAAVFALAAPASALAQSAGDDQYRDPFAGQDQGQQDAAGGGSGSGAGGDSGGGAPTAPAPTASAPVAEPTSAAPAATLPYTGLPALAMGGIGTLLLAAGVGLRRSSR